MTFSTRYSTNNTSFELDSDLGSVFTIRSYCDDPAGTTYLTKPPVCKLSISPNPQLLGFAMDWDIGDSSSTTGTIDTYSIDWGGSADISEIIDADFQFGPTSGTIIYNSVGIYTIEATVTDTTGDRSKPCFITVEVAFEPVEMQRIYFSDEDDTLNPPLVEFNFRDIPDVIGPNRWYSRGSHDMAYVAFDSGVANPAWAEGTGLTFAGAENLVSAGFSDVAILGSDARTMMVRFEPNPVLLTNYLAAYGTFSGLEGQALYVRFFGDIKGFMITGGEQVGVNLPLLTAGVTTTLAHSYTAATPMDTAAMYVGGLPAADQSGSSAALLATTASELTIGSRVDNTRFLIGVITDIAIWDNALLPAEVLSKHNEWNS